MSYRIVEGEEKGIERGEEEGLTASRVT